MASDFHSLRIKSIEKSTQDCSIIEFDVPMELKDAFQYVQGQYLRLKATVNGEELVRSYSLCSSPLDNEWKIGVKQIPEGRFSTFANNELEVNQELEVAPPDGNFYIEVDANKQNNYVAFAAGSGITPILSIIKTHLEAEASSSFKLFYVNQSVASIILKEELEAIKNKYLERFEIFHLLTRQPRNIPLFNGRLDRGKMEIIFKTICDIDYIDHYFSCGPEQMVLMIESFLIEKGVDKKNIHFELFHTEGAAPELKAQIKASYSGKTSKIDLTEGGKQYQFEMEQGSDNILDAALKNAADLPFACKGGVCCTCRAKLVEGEVKMLLNYALEDEEVEAGYILTCQAIPITENIVVDFDA